MKFIKRIPSFYIDLSLLAFTSFPLIFYYSILIRE